MLHYLLHFQSLLKSVVQLKVELDLHSVILLKFLL